MENNNLPSLESFIPQEVEIHYKRPLFDTMKYIKCSKDAETILREFIDANRIDLKEFFFVMLLTNAFQLLGISKVASGSTQGVQINTKEIFQLALKANASAILVCHNHPSGTLKISYADKKQTKKLQTLAKLLDITLADHIIITSESYISFADKGIL